MTYFETKKINDMRNRKLTYAALALLTLGFAACQQEEDFAPQGQEINLNITAGSVIKAATAKSNSSVVILLHSKEKLA